MKKALTIIAAASSLALGGCVTTGNGSYGYIREEPVVVLYDYAPVHPRVIVRSVPINRRQYPDEVNHSQLRIENNHCDSLPREIIEKHNYKSQKDFHAKSQFSYPPKSPQPEKFQRIYEQKREDNKREAFTNPTCPTRRPERRK